MNIRRVEIDCGANRLTVDADVMEEFGREFEFDLVTLPELKPLATEIARRSRRAVVARLRDWLNRLEDDATAATVEPSRSPAGVEPP